MTDSPDYRPAEELPRRLEGEIEFPPPCRPLHFEDDVAFLAQVRDGLKGYDRPAQQQQHTTEGFRWMQPAEEDSRLPTNPRK